MKRVFALTIAAVLLVLCAFAAEGAYVSDAQEEAVCVFESADGDDANDCACVCHVFYGVRDTLIERIADKTIDCKTLFQVVSYCVKLFTWRVLGVRQYCECGARHY